MDAGIGEIGERGFYGGVEILGFCCSEKVDLVVVHAGDDVHDGGFFSCGESCLAVDFALYAEFGDDGGAVTESEPFFELFASDAFGTGCEHDDESQGFDGLIGVEESFMGLDEIFCGGGCGDYEVCAFGDWGGEGVVR